MLISYLPLRAFSTSTTGLWLFQYIITVQNYSHLVFLRIISLFFSCFGSSGARPSPFAPLLFLLLLLNLAILIMFVVGHK